MYYAVEVRKHETVSSGRGKSRIEWKSSVGLPTFFLNSNVQAIFSVEQAERIARVLFPDTEKFSIVVVECADGET